MISTVVLPDFPAEGDPNSTWFTAYTLGILVFWVALSFAVAHATSAPFIVMPEFGTRCSTLVTASRRGDWRFLERRFDPDGSSTGETTASFGAAEGP